MLSSFFPTRGPRSSECSNVRSRDRADWLDVTMATILIKNYPGCCLLWCDSFPNPQKFPATERFMSLCFVLSCFCWEWWNSETLLLNLRKLWCRDCCCHPSVRKLCTSNPPAHADIHTCTQSNSSSLTVGLCHDEGFVTPSLLPEERSVQVHSYITQSLTAAALSAKIEKGTDV